MANAFTMATQGSSPFAGASRASSPATAASGLIQTPQQARQKALDTFLSSSRATQGLVPTTPVKSITTPEGHVTTFHAPANTDTGSTVPKANPNGLTDSQVSQGYSTIQGDFDPVTGIRKGLIPQNPDGTPVSQANAYQNAGAQTANEASTQQRLVDLSNSPSQAYADAQNAYQSAIQRQSELNQNLAKYKQGIEAQGIPMAGIVGQEANLSNSAAAQQDAAAQAVTQAQQALGYANTQQGLQSTAAQGAYTGSQNQANRQSTAQGNIFQASIPQSVAPGNTLYNPLLGTGVNGSLGDQASRSLVGANAALVQPYQDQYNTAQATVQTIGNTENLFNDFLSKTSGTINPTSSTDVNALLQKLGGKFSSADVANFQNLVSSLRSQYAGYLAARGGMNPTQAGDAASSLLPENASVDTIKSVLNTLKQESDINLQTSKDKLQNALAGVNGANTSQTTPNIANSSSVANWGWNGQ